MAKKEEGATIEGLGVGDVIPNWAGCIARTHETLSTTVKETGIDTNIDMFGDRAWLIHEIEVDLSGLLTAIATLHGGLTPVFTAVDLYFGKPNVSAPTLLSPGILGCVKRVVIHHFDTDGEYGVVVDAMDKWIPPGGVMPYAAGELAVYAQLSPDAATLRALAIRTRVAFTSIKTTSKLWRELAERWHLLA